MFLVVSRHLSPRGHVGQTVHEAKLGTQQFVNRADYVRNDGTGRVENAALILSAGSYSFANSS